MADRSPIEWTDATWNPIRARNRETGRVGWFCTHASEGCRNCYSEGFNMRLGNRVEFKAQFRDRVELYLDEKMLTQPLRWKRPRMIFVCSMTDTFGEFVPDAWIDRMFAVMALAPQHTFQVLTKRAARMRAYMAARDRPDRWGEAVAQQGYRGPMECLDVRHVWLGVSAEDQARAEERIPDLLETPAAVRFLSAEPLLGPIDLTRLDTLVFRGCEAADAVNGLGRDIFGWPQRDIPRLDWVIAGGESGACARPMHAAWARQLRDDCERAGVAFFFKQWGAWAPCQSNDGEWVTDAKGFCRLTSEGERRADGWPMQRVGKGHAGRELDGRTHDAMPQTAEAGL